MARPEVKKKKTAQVSVNVPMLNKGLWVFGKMSVHTPIVHTQNCFCVQLLTKSLMAAWSTVQCQ